MNSLQNNKTVTGLAPISLNSAAATALTCDTLGYTGGWAVCTVQLGVVGGAATVNKIEESDDDSSYAAISDFTGAGTTGSLRLYQTADAGKAFEYHVKLGGSRKRYLKMQITTGATTLVSAVWKLHDANTVPTGLTALGLAGRVIA